MSRPDEIRVDHLQPVPTLPARIETSRPLRHNAFKTQLAGLGEHDRALCGERLVEPMPSLRRLVISRTSASRRFSGGSGHGDDRFGRIPVVPDASSDGENAQRPDIRRGLGERVKSDPKATFERQRNCPLPFLVPMTLNGPRAIAPCDVPDWQAALG